MQACAFAMVFQDGGEARFACLSVRLRYHSVCTCINQFSVLVLARELAFASHVRRSVYGPFHYNV